MTIGLQPYPRYRSARLPWLARIPDHWREERAKYFFREVDERSETGEEELLSVSHLTGVTPRSDKSVTMFKAESYVGHKLCRPGDLVVNTMWAWMSALGVTSRAGIVSPAYGVYRPTTPRAMVPGFFDHLLRTPPYRSEYRCRSTGIQSSRLRLYPDQFLQIPIICPPSGKQEKILRYLTHKGQQIRGVVRAKRRLVEFLREEEATLITRAVTQGLSPSEPVEPCGIPWLPGVPRGWELVPLKRYWTVTDCKHITVPFVDDGVPVVSVREAQTFDLDLSAARRTAPEWSDHLREGGRAPTEGDIRLS
jgi:type I restriction enzyme, S subunit